MLLYCAAETKCGTESQQKFEKLWAREERVSTNNKKVLI